MHVQLPAGAKSLFANNSFIQTFEPAYTSDDIEKAFKHKKIASLIGIEGYVLA